MNFDALRPGDRVLMRYERKWWATFLGWVTPWTLLVRYDGETAALRAYVAHVRAIEPQAASGSSGSEPR